MDVVKRSDCILVYGSTTKGDVVKRSDCILVHGSTTKGGVVKRSDCILVYGSTTKGDVVKRSDCILVYGSTTKGGVVKWSDCILVYGSTTKGDVVKRSDCILVHVSTTKGDVVRWSSMLAQQPLCTRVSRLIHCHQYQTDMLCSMCIHHTCSNMSVMWQRCLHVCNAGVTLLFSLLYVVSWLQVFQSSCWLHGPLHQVVQLPLTSTALLASENCVLPWQLMNSWLPNGQCQ